MTDSPPASARQHGRPGGRRCSSFQQPSSFVKPACGAAIALLIAFLTADTAFAANLTTGPESGKLVLVGGGDRDYAMFREFIRLAGGTSVRLVIVPTAASSRQDYDYIHHRTARYAREVLKMKHVVVAHTHTRTTAQPPAVPNSSDRFRTRMLSGSPAAASGVWSMHTWELMPKWSSGTC